MDSLHPRENGRSGGPPELPRPTEPPSWRERFVELQDQLRTLTSSARLIDGRLLWLGVAAAAALVALGLVTFAAWPRTDRPPELVLPMAQSADVVVPTPVPVEVMIHVSGAVARPGLYTLVEGDRVAAALEVAGGETEDADLERLNLAQPLVDGQRIFVPRRDQPVPAVVGPVAPASPGGQPDAPLDLNTADLRALDDLPGIGPSTAAAILAYREEHGGFVAVAELEEVPGIGPAKLSAISDLVMVG